MVAVLVLAICLALAPAAQANFLYVPPSEDLLFDADSQIDGDVEDRVGAPLASGAVNSGSATDLIIGSSRPIGSGDGSHVLFGPVGPLVDLRTASGYLLTTLNTGTDYTALDAGDVNGDGRADVLAGGPSAYGAGTVAQRNGAVYVSFGQDGTSDRNPEGPGDFDGFEINGAGPSDEAGSGVAAGDTNGDGLDDVIVGAEDENAVYVVFGKSNEIDVNLASLGSAGYKISPASPGARTGSSVASAGDVNLDGREDIIIGADAASNGGAAYLVFGKNNTTPLDLDTLGNGGYRIQGADSGDGAGAAVANAGDVNLDGRPDHVVGAPYAGDGVEGAAYVVFGKTTSGTVDLGALGSGGFEIAGAYPSDETGAAVSGGRDFNGDGRTDVVVGAPRATFNGRLYSGSGYVIYGKSAKKTVSLDGLDSNRGYRIDGPAPYAFAGEAVASVQSVTGAAGNDVVVGAPGNEANGRNSSGSVFVIEEGRGPGARSAGITDVELGTRTFVATAASGVTSAQANARRGPRLRYRLRRRATVTLRVHRILSGRRSGKPTGRQRCRKSTKALSAARRCHRLVLVGRKVIRHRTRGRKSTRVPTRLRGRRLKPGRYQLSVTARERNGREWGPAVARLRVKRK